MSLHGPVAGIYRDDIARPDQALTGVSYPAEKWQLIAHAERDPVGLGRPDPRTIRQLWALPAGRYPGLVDTCGGSPYGDANTMAMRRPAETTYVLITMGLGSPRLVDLGRSRPRSGTVIPVARAQARTSANDGTGVVQGGTCSVRRRPPGPGGGGWWRRR